MHVSDCGYLRLSDAWGLGYCAYGVWTGWEFGVPGAMLERRWLPLILRSGSDYGTHLWVRMLALTGRPGWLAPCTQAAQDIAPRSQDGKLRAAAIPKMGWQDCLGAGWERRQWARRSTADKACIAWVDSKGSRGGWDVV